MLRGRSSGRTAPAVVRLRDGGTFVVSDPRPATRPTAPGLWRMDTVLPVADGVVADPVRAGDLDLGGMVLCLPVQGLYETLGPSFPCRSPQ